MLLFVNEAILKQVEMMWAMLLERCEVEIFGIIVFTKAMRMDLI